MPGVLLLGNSHWSEMRQHVASCLPEEACGLIGGKSGQTRLVIPITNDLHSPDRFRMNPNEQLKGFETLASHGLDLIAIFHSHPNGPPYPSEVDLVEFAYPGVFTILWFLKDGIWQAGAFDLEKMAHKKVTLDISGG